MGLNIGAAARAVSALPPAAYTRPERAAVPRDAQLADERSVVPSPEEPQIQAGFGENTLSPTSAALEALDSNLEVAGQLVPTVQELRERARVIQAARPDAIETRTEPRNTEFRRLETVRPEPSPEVRNFVASNEATPPREAPAPEPEVADGVATGNAPPSTATTRFDIRI